MRVAGARVWHRFAWLGYFAAERERERAGLVRLDDKFRDAETLGKIAGVHGADAFVENLAASSGLQPRVPTWILALPAYAGCAGWSRPFQSYASSINIGSQALRRTWNLVKNNRQVLAWKPFPPLQIVRADRIGVNIAGRHRFVRVQHFPFVDYRIDRILEIHVRVDAFLFVTVFALFPNLLGRSIDLEP